MISLSFILLARALFALLCSAPLLRVSHQRQSSKLHLARYSNLCGYLLIINHARQPWQGDAGELHRRFAYKFFYLTVFGCWPLGPDYFETCSFLCECLAGYCTKLHFTGPDFRVVNRWKMEVNFIRRPRPTGGK